MKTQSGLIPAERIANAIYFIRGEKVMLDRDLAALYGVETNAQAAPKLLNRVDNCSYIAAYPPWFSSVI